MHAAGLAAVGMVATTHPLPGAVAKAQAGPSTRTMGATLRALLEAGETFEHVAAYDVLTPELCTIT